MFSNRGGVAFSASSMYGPGTIWISAPVIREGLYAGADRVIDNSDGTKAVKYDDTGYNATTVALATRTGGATGALLGECLGCGAGGAK